MAGGQMLVAATSMAGAPGLLAAAAGYPSGGIRVASGVGLLGRSCGQGLGTVMAFATTAVKALFEQAYFGLEFIDALLQFAFALLQTSGKIGLALRELF